MKGDKNEQVFDSNRPKKVSSVAQAKLIVSMGKSIHDRIARAEQKRLNQKTLKNGLGSQLTYAQIQMLFIIKNNEPVSMTQLSELLGVAPPSVTSMVTRLVDKGYLVRLSSPDDRRKVNVAVSQNVSSFIQKMEKRILLSVVEIVKQIGPATSQRWCEVLADINKLLTKNM